MVAREAKQGMLGQRVHDPANARPIHCACAHAAGFGTGVERAGRQRFGAHVLGGIGHCDQLGVLRRVTQRRLGVVAGFGNHVAVAVGDQGGDVSELVAHHDAEPGVAFSQPGYAKELEFQQMGKLIMSHVCHPDHPLAQLERVRFDDLHIHRRLAFSAHTSKLPSSEYLRSTKVWQAESYLALLEMVRAGLGWATLPRQLILRELAAGELVELQLLAYPHTDWHIGVDLLWARQRPLGKAGRWLKECLQARKVFELDRMGQATTL